MNEQEVDQRQYSYSQPLPDSSVIEWLEDSEGYLHYQYLSLLGMKEIKDEKGNERLVKIGDQIMNEKGVHTFQTVVRGILRKENYLTNMPEKRLKPILVQMYKRALMQFAVNAEEYELAASNVGFVMMLIRMDCEAALRRSVGGKERETLFPRFSMSSKEIGQEQENIKPSGLRWPF